MGGSPKSSASIREKHALVWYIERGTLAFLAGDWESAIRHFSRASDFIVSERSQRIGDVAAEAIGNETSGTCIAVRSLIMCTRNIIAPCRI